MIEVGSLVRITGGAVFNAHRSGITPVARVVEISGFNNYQQVALRVVVSSQLDHFSNYRKWVFNTNVYRCQEIHGIIV